jgi:hypothetical protein
MPAKSKHVWISLDIQQSTFRGGRVFAKSPLFSLCFVFSVRLNACFKPNKGDLLLRQEPRPRRPNFPLPSDPPSCGPDRSEPILSAPASAANSYLPPASSRLLSLLSGFCYGVGPSNIYAAFRFSVPNPPAKKNSPPAYLFLLLPGSSRSAPPPPTPLLAPTPARASSCSPSLSTCRRTGCPRTRRPPRPARSRGDGAPGLRRGRPDGLRRWLPSSMPRCGRAPPLGVGAADPRLLDAASCRRSARPPRNPSWLLLAGCAGRSARWPHLSVLHSLLLFPHLMAPPLDSLSLADAQWPVPVSLSLADVQCPVPMSRTPPAVCDAAARLGPVGGRRCGCPSARPAPGH